MQWHYEQKRDWVWVGDFNGNSSRWHQDVSETVAVIAEARVRHRLQGQRERDDMLCSVMGGGLTEVMILTDHIVNAEIQMMCCDGSRDSITYIPLPGDTQAV